MTWPSNKETFPTWENKNLEEGKLGTKIDAVILNNVFRLLERIQDSLGVSFISGYTDLKDRLDKIKSMRYIYAFNVLPTASYDKYVGMNNEGNGYDEIGMMGFDDNLIVDEMHCKAWLPIASGSVLNLRLYKTGNYANKEITYTSSDTEVKSLTGMNVQFEQRDLMALRLRETGGVAPGYRFMGCIVARYP